MNVKKGGEKKNRKQNSKEQKMVNENGRKRLERKK